MFIYLPFILPPCLYSFTSPSFYHHFYTHLTPLHSTTMFILIYLSFILPPFLYSFTSPSFYQPCLYSFTSPSFYHHVYTHLPLLHSTTIFILIYLPFILTTCLYAFISPSFYHHFYTHLTPLHSTNHVYIHSTYLKYSVCDNRLPALYMLKCVW